MSFYFNDQEFSDKEVAQSAREARQARHEWCEQQAREYLATKQRAKFYHIYYFVPEVEMDMYYNVPQELVDKVKASIDADIAENGPYVSKEDAASARRDIVSDMDTSGYIDVDEPYEPDLLDIDFDDYLYCYHVRTKRFDPVSGEQQEDGLCLTALTDEDYVQVLTELLYAPQVLSFDALRRLLPAICQKMANDCTRKDSATALILDEMNRDVDAILQQHGGREKTPYIGLFNNPFVLIAEHNASKEQEDPIDFSNS